MELFYPTTTSVTEAIFIIFQHHRTTVMSQESLYPSEKVTRSSSWSVRPRIYNGISLLFVTLSSFSLIGELLSTLGVFFYDRPEFLLVPTLGMILIFANLVGHLVMLFSIVSREVLGKSSLSVALYFTLSGLFYMINGMPFDLLTAILGILAPSLYFYEYFLLKRDATLIEYMDSQSFSALHRHIAVLENELVRLRDMEV